MVETNTYFKLNYIIWNWYRYCLYHDLWTLSAGYSGNGTINQYVVKVDWIFTGTSGFIQPVTGFWMMYLLGYPIKSLWIIGSSIAYIITAVCWFIVVYLQIKIRNITIEAAQYHTELPPKYYVYFKWWFFLGWPAFLSLLIVFYLMVMKPM